MSDAAIYLLGLALCTFVGWVLGSFVGLVLGYTWAAKRCRERHDTGGDV